MVDVSNHGFTLQFTTSIVVADSQYQGFLCPATVLQPQLQLYQLHLLLILCILNQSEQKEKTTMEYHYETIKYCTISSNHNK